MSGRKQNYSLIEAIKESAAQGKRRDDILRELGISYDSLNYYAKRYGIKIARKKRSVSKLEDKIKKHSARIRQIKDIIDSENYISLRAIGRKIGRSYECVRYFIDIAGMRDYYINKKKEKKQKVIEDIAKDLEQGHDIEAIAATHSISAKRVRSYIKMSKELEECYRQMKARTIQKKRNYWGMP